MRILILTILLLMQSEIEMYIGNNIDSIDGAILVDLEEISNSKTYHLNAEKKFLGKPFDFMILTTDDTDTITKVLFSIKEKIGIDFYNLMVEKYGEPCSMFKMDVIEDGQPIHGDAYVSTRKKGVAKPCSFEENPLYIGWNNSNYKIEVDLGADNNRTTIVIGNQNYILKPF